MKQRGRKSSAELAVVPVPLEVRRPPPPEHLSEPQADIWRDVVATMPAGWFQRSHEPLLTSYCRHVSRSAELDRVLRETMCDGSEATIGEADRLLRMAERETRAIIACARSLRLTHQAQMHPRTAGRAVANAPEGPRPWDR